MPHAATPPSTPPRIPRHARDPVHLRLAPAPRSRRPPSSGTRRRRCRPAARRRFRLLPLEERADGELDLLARARVRDLLHLLDQRGHVGVGGAVADLRADLLPSSFVSSVPRGRGRERRRERGVGARVAAAVGGGQGGGRATAGAAERGASAHRREFDEEDDADVAGALAHFDLVADHERVLDGGHLLGEAVHLRRADAHAARLQRRVRAAVHHDAARVAHRPRHLHQVTVVPTGSGRARRQRRCGAARAGGGRARSR